MSLGTRAQENKKKRKERNCLGTLTAADLSSAAPPRDFSQLVRKLSRNPEPNFLVRPALPHRVGKFEAVLSSCRLCRSSPRLFRRLPADAAPSKIRKLPRLASRNPRRTARVRKTSPSGRAPPLPPPEPKDATRVRKSAVARSCPTRFPAATRPASARASACSELVHLPALCPCVVPKPQAEPARAQLSLRSTVCTTFEPIPAFEPSRFLLLQPSRPASPTSLLGKHTCLAVRTHRVNLQVLSRDTEDQIFVPTGAHVARVRERAGDWIPVEAQVGAKASWRATRRRILPRRGARRGGDKGGKGAGRGQPEEQPAVLAVDPNVPVTQADLAAMEQRYQDMLQAALAPFLAAQQSQAAPVQNQAALVQDQTVIPPAPVEAQPVPVQLSAEAKHLRDFRKYNPKTFDGSMDNPTKAQMWLTSIETIFRYIKCREDQKVQCAVFFLEDRGTTWWETAERMLGGDVSKITWEQFKENFYAKFFSVNVKHAKLQEFINLE
ncbi:gag protease polyprotein [Cucumis melo var. makuwa]|uniref:Gag protease polyprotein n=1 Tax=Cucumis melo var. makuwa TaxID=1194695 RepID=A0A5A7U2G0_CUCMM|nr:gag protease polyprotein [Cucumis melo var. makuwa]